MNERTPLTLSDVLHALQERKLKFHVGGRYILTQCPAHNDATPSAQIYLDDFFVNCHVCGRMSPFKALPELRSDVFHEAFHAPNDQKGTTTPMTINRPSQTPYRTFNLIDYWRTLKPLPETATLHGVPSEVLNELGWRINDGKVIAGPGWFIPYFTRLKNGLPFAQVRHLEGERRFTFLKDAKPTVYGKWNLEPGDRLFVVEGPSDCAVLQYCQVPWIGLPSSSSGVLLKEMAKWCKDHQIELVYAGDNDSAGDKLRQALDGVMSYRSYQPPKRFKDWGEMLEVQGQEAVMDYCRRELF